MIVAFWKFQCECGCKARFVKIGVSSLGQLVAIWPCDQCGHEIMVRIPLEDIIGSIPNQPAEAFTKEDLEFLRAIGGADEVRCISAKE